jgi:hypothetical protein
MDDPSERAWWTAGNSMRSLSPLTTMPGHAFAFPQRKNIANSAGENEHLVIVPS